MYLKEAQRTATALEQAIDNLNNLVSNYPTQQEENNTLDEQLTAIKLMLQQNNQPITE
jgi:outer membrane protein assembly factor BamD (BamD/ComL family)